MTRRTRLLLLLALALLAPLAAVRLSIPAPVVTIGADAGMDPDYRNVTVPPNLAPLNFRVPVAARGYEAALAAPSGERLVVRSRRPLIAWPEGRWHRLLQANRGRSLTLTIQVRGRDGRWREHLQTSLRVAQQPVDSYLYYRFLRPLHNTWGSLEIRQRDLTSFAERVLVGGRQYENGCANCHSVAAGRPRRFALGIRSEAYGSGTLVAVDEQLFKLQNKIGYPAWRPSGELLVFTINQVRQWFHAAAAECREVLDLQSGLGFWRVGSEAIETIPAMCPPDRLLTFPCWSPDGNYLYYCSGPLLWTDLKTVPPENSDKIRYDLMRLRFDGQRWGEPELVLSAAEAGGSIMEPRPLPDGSVIVVLCDFGTFPIHRPESDLYRVWPGQPTRFERLAISSELADTWHSISQNGAWMVFSSKRRDGVFVKPYLTCLADGEPTKPLLLPVEDPAIWDSLLESYNVPELAAAPLPFSARQIGQAIRSGPGIELAMPEVYAPPKEDGPQDDWKQR